MKKALPALLLVIGYWLLVIGNPQSANAQGTCIELPPHYPPQANICEANQPFTEVTPGCVYAPSLDILFCQGNNYRACATDPQIPAPTPGDSNRNFWFPQDVFPGGKILYNGTTHDVPPGGVHICDSNVFACQNAVCLGGSASSALFDGTTEVVAKAERSWGGNLEIQTRIWPGVSQIFAEIYSRLFDTREDKAKTLRPPVPSDDAIHKLAPAAFNYSEDAPDKFEGRIFTPGCELHVPSGVSGLTIVSREKIDYEADKELGKKIARSTVFQASSVPGYQTYEKVKVVKEGLPEGEAAEQERQMLSGCPPEEGIDTTAILDPATENTVVEVDNLFERIRQFFGNLLASFFGEPVRAVVKVNNWSQGYGTLGERAVGDDGFYNSFVPAMNFLGDEAGKDLNQFIVEAENPVATPSGHQREQQRNLPYPKAGKIIEGYRLLQKSLYPESMQADIEKFLP